MCIGARPHLVRAYCQAYDIVIRTDLKSSPPTYAGEAVATVDVQSSTSKLEFHAGKNLSITHIAISSSDLKTTSAQLIPLSALSYDAATERAVLDLKDLAGGGLKEGQKGVKVWFRFEAELEKSMHGYYKSEGDLDEKTGEKPVYVAIKATASSS